MAKPSKVISVKARTLVVGDKIWNKSTGKAQDVKETDAFTCMHHIHINRNDCYDNDAVVEVLVG